MPVCLDINRHLTAELESRTQGSRPSPRTAFARTDSLEAKDRNAQGQGPRTQVQVLSKKKVFTKIFQAISRKKRSSQKFFRRSQEKKGLHKKFSGDLKKKRSSQKLFKRSPQKNVFQKIFQALHRILTIQKILLSSSRGQANF